MPRPILFTIYLDGLLEILKLSGIGCQVGHTQWHRNGGGGSRDSGPPFFLDGVSLSLSTLPSFGSCIKKMV